MSARKPAHNCSHSFISNSENLQTTKMSTGEWLNNFGAPYPEILCCNNNKKNNNQLLIQDTTLVDHKDIMLSEQSQPPKITHFH